MADTLDLEQFLPKGEAEGGLDLDQFLPEDQRPAKPGLIERLYRQPVEEKETAPERVEPPPVGSDPMGDSAGLSIMRDAPAPAPAPSRVRDSSVVADQPFNTGRGNEGDPLADMGLGAANAAGGNVFGDFYDPLGSNVVAGQVASKGLTPFTMAAAKGAAGSIGDAARGLDVLVGLGTNGEVQFGWAKDIADWGTNQAKMVRGEVNSLKDVEGIGDFGTYLIERFGEGFGGFAPFMLGGVATGVGIGAVQGIGGTYNALLEDKGIQDKLKSGELTEQDVRKLSLIGGAVNGLAMGALVKFVGDPGKFTKNFSRDLARLAVADPAMFAVTGGAAAATNELLAGYFGGNAEIPERIARTVDATVNGFFSGVPFGGVKVAGRVERRAEALDRLNARQPSQPIQAIPENGVAQETAAALSKDAGTAAASSDVDPTIKAATQADIRARAKAAMEKVKAEKAAEEAAAKEAGKKSDDEKIKAGIEATKPKTNFGDTAIDRLTKKGITLTDEQAAEVRARVDQGIAGKQKFGEILDGLYTEYGVGKPADAGVTVPEAPQTLEVQFNDLVGKTRNIMFFPAKDGKAADTSVVGERPKGVFEVVHPEGTYWYRTGKGGTSKEKLNAARQNPDALAELLGYGPSKEAVAATDAPGTPDIAAVERTPDGTEVKAAATNPELADQTVAALEANKGAPDRTVTIEPAENVTAGRAEGDGKAPEAANQPEPFKSDVRLIKDSNGDVQYYDIGDYKNGTGIRFYLGARQVIFMYKGKQYSFSTWDRRQGAYLLDQMDQTPMPKEFQPLVRDAVAEKIKTQEQFVERLKEAEREMIENYLAKTEAPAPKAPEAEVPAPKAPEGAGPKTSIVVQKTRRLPPELQAKRKAAEQPKPEAPVTPEVTTPQPEQPQRGRILRSAEQEAELAREAANAQRGFRLTAEGDGRDFGVEPDLTNPKARDRFTRRAQAAVAAQGDAAPQYYKDAAEAKAAQTKGRSAANMERTKIINDAWQQEHTANLEVIERRRVAEEEAARAAEQPEPETPVKLEKRKYTDEQIAKAIEEIESLSSPKEIEQLRALPEELRQEMAALHLDSKKSDLTGGQSDVNDQKNAISLDENRTARADADDVVDNYARLKGEPISLFDRLMAKLDAEAAEAGKLAERLNAMTDEQFKNWIVRSEKGEFLAAVRAADEFGITRLKTDEFRRLLDEIADEPIVPRREGTVRDMFAENETAPRNGLMGFIESRIMSLVGDMKVMIVDADTMRRAAIRSGRSDKTAGLYDPINNRILLNEEFYVPGTVDARSLLVHEGLHGVLANTMRRNPTFKKQIEDLRKFVEERLQNDPALKAEFEALDVRYGLKDADEFISETWANRDFQELLLKVDLNEAQMRSLGLNPSDGWVRNALRGLVDMVRKALGTTPNTRSALEQAIRFTDRALEMREALGAGADKSALTPAEMARAMAAKDVRPIQVESFAAKRDPEAIVRRELESQGVDRETARELAAVLKEEMGADFNLKNAKPFIDELASNFKSNEAPNPKSDAEIQKGVDNLLGKAINENEVFVPTKAFNRPKVLGLWRNDQIAQAADRFFGKFTNPVRAITDLIEQRGRARAKYIDEAEPTLTALYDAQRKYGGTKVWEDFTSFIQEVTMANVHPDVPLTDKKNEHLGQDALKGMWSKGRHPELARRWEKLKAEQPELARVYEETRDLLTEYEQKMRVGVIEAILRGAGHEDAALAARFYEGVATKADMDRVGPIVTKHLVDAVEVTKIAGPYFNLARRGDWVVRGTYEIDAPTNARRVDESTFDFTDRKEAIAWAQKQDLRASIETIRIDPKTGERFFTDADGKQVPVTSKDIDGEVRFRVKVQNQHVEFVESAREARKRTKELAGLGLKVADAEPRRYERNAPNRDMLSDQMRALMETVNKREEFSRLTPQQRNELIGTLNEFSLRLLGSSRVQSTRLPRRYIEGASKDIARNTLEYVERASAYLAKVDFQGRTDQALKELEARTQALSKLGTGNGEGARAIANEIEKRALGVNDYEGPSVVGGIADRLNSASYSDKLLSPAYSMMNFMQPFMMLFPYLAGPHGAARTSFHMLKAYWDISGLMTAARGIGDTGRALIGRDVTTNYVETIRKRLKNDKERELFDFLIERNAIDPDAGFDIARLIKKRDGVIGKLDTVLGYFSDVARAMPRAIEAMNRTVSALAAYRLEMKRNGGDHEKAMVYAQDAVNNTQFNSSRTNMPPIFQNPYLRMPLQFKSYAQGAFHMVGQQFGRAYRGEKRGDRYQALKTLAFVAATHGMMAGVLGLPGLEALKIGLMIFNGLGWTDFKYSDFEKMVRRKANELLGKETGEAVTRGVTRMIPGGFAVDTSSRLNFPGLTFGEPRSNKENDVKAFLLDTAFGAPAGLIGDYVKGMGEISKGEYAKAAELMIPVKFVADGLRAVRQGMEGKKNESGRETLSPYSTQEATVRALGFTPAREAEESEKRGAVGGAIARYNQERQKLIADWVSNPNNRGKAMIAIQKFNRDKPKDAQIDMKDLRTSEKRRKTEEKNGTMVDGLRTSKRNRYLTEDTDIYNTRN